MNGHGNGELAQRSLDKPQRRYRRYRTQSILVDNPVVGRVVNVGQAGFAVETPQGLAVGASYVFKVRLGDKHLRLAGRVQWCRLTGTESDGDDGSLPIYRAGVALAESTAGRAWQVALQRLTEQTGYVVWHRPRASIGASQRVQAEGAAPVQSEHAAS